MIAWAAVCACRQRVYTLYNIFAECETFADHRQRWFGARELSLPFDVLLTVGNILGFLRDIQIQCLLYDEGDDDPEEETHQNQD